jgi:DNA-binding response OmpR family regulator
MRLGMEAGGYRLLLRWLLDYDLTGLSFRAAPKTRALLEQKQMSQAPLEMWWFDSLMDGRIIGLEKGSDDYLPKPFLPRELIIRVGKILDRVYGGVFRSEKQEEACKK